MKIRCVWLNLENETALLLDSELDANVSFGLLFKVPIIIIRHEKKSHFRLLIRSLENWIIFFVFLMKIFLKTSHISCSNFTKLIVLKWPFGNMKYMLIWTFSIVVIERSFSYSDSLFFKPKYGLIVNLDPPFESKLRK